MDECQFYDKKRLEQLHRQEEQLFAEAKEKGDIPNDLTSYEVRGGPAPLPLPYSSVFVVVCDARSRGSCKCMHAWSGGRGIWLGV